MFSSVMLYGLIKTPGTLSAIWDLYLQDHLLALSHPSYLPAEDAWDKPHEVLLCNLSSQHLALSPVPSHQVTAKGIEGSWG